MIPKAKTERNQLGATISVGKHLVIDPRVCHGALTFRGTRVPVETVLLRLQRRSSWPGTATVDHALCGA